MRLEHVILIAMWLVGIVGFVLFITRKDRREGLFSLMVFQSFVWLCDMFSFEFGLLSAPVRLFPKATDLALTINYIFYPVLFSIYYVKRKSKGNRRKRITFFLIWISAITLFDVVIERYTDLLEYGLITWYWMWVYIGFLFFVSQVCSDWFFKDKASFQLDGGNTHEN